MRLLVGKTERMNALDRKTDVGCVPGVFLG